MNSQVASIPLQQIHLDGLLTISLAAHQDRLKKNFQVILSRLRDLEECVGLADKLRSFQRDTRNGLARLQAIIKSNELNRQQGMTKQRVQSLIGSKVLQIFKSLDENVQNGTVFQKFRGKVDLQIMQKVYQLVNRQIAGLSIQKLLNKKQKKNAQSTPNKDSQGQPTQEQDDFLQVLRVNLSKSGELLTKTRDQMGGISNRLHTIQHYLSNKNLSNLIGKKFQSVLGQPELADKKQKKAQAQPKDQYLRKGKQEKQSKKHSPESSRQKSSKEVNRKSDKNLWRSVKKQDKKKQSQHTNKKDLIKQQKVQNTVVHNISTFQRKFRMDQATLKHFDLKHQYNMLLRQLDSRIDNKVNRDIFLTFIQQVEERFQNLRAATSSSENGQIKKALLFVDNKVNSIINALQSPQEDDPLIAKRKWACLSCQKIFEKYTARIGNHSNWQAVPLRKTSPSKGGGYTGQLFTSRKKQGQNQISLQ